MSTKTSVLIFISYFILQNFILYAQSLEFVSGKSRIFYRREPNVQCYQYCYVRIGLSFLPHTIICFRKTDRYRFYPGRCTTIILYYFSRIHRIYRIPIIIYGLASYSFIIASYFLHGGINGPILLLFFLSAHVLIAFSKKRERIYMLLASVVSGLGVLFVEFKNPSYVTPVYTNGKHRVFEIGAYYVICLVFIYVITIFLRNNYNRERKLALTRETMLRKQNETLSKIAFKQSHEFRGPLATIMQVMTLIKFEDAYNNKEYFELLDSAVGELDQKIREVVDISRDLKPVS